MDKGHLRREGESVAMHEEEEKKEELGDKVVIDALGNEIKVHMSSVFGWVALPSSLLSFLPLFLLSGFPFSSPLKVVYHNRLTLPHSSPPLPPSGEQANPTLGQGQEEGN